MPDSYKVMGCIDCPCAAVFDHRNMHGGHRPVDSGSDEIPDTGSAFCLFYRRKIPPAGGALFGKKCPPVAPSWCEIRHGRPLYLVAVDERGRRLDTDGGEE